MAVTHRSASYLLELRHDGGVPEVVVLDIGLAFRLAGTGGLRWTPTDHAEAWHPLEGEDREEFDEAYPGLLNLVHALLVGGQVAA